MNHLYVYLIGLLPLAGMMVVAADGPPAGAHSERRWQVVRHTSGPGGVSTVIRFDHATGTTARVVVDASGRIVREHTVPGRPQSSRAEFDGAVAIIGRDERLAQLARGAEFEGGFIVDGPAGAAPWHRYLQVRVLSPDRRMLRQVVVVDLTAGVVASARAWFE